MRKMIINFVTVILFSLILAGCANYSSSSESQTSALEWPEVKKENKPWSYWYWMGNAVDKENVSELLETYNEAGLGGMHIVAFYGAKGQEEKFIDFLSPEWIEMLNHTISEAERLEMGIDMTSGSGWNFGGPQVTLDDAVKKVVIKKFELGSGEILQNTLFIEDELDKDKIQKIQALMAHSNEGEHIDLTDKVDSQGKLNWKAPEGKWELYALFQSGKTGALVERASPGAQGYLVNPFSSSAMKNYLDRFDTVFTENNAQIARAFYHDSYEYHYATWCNDFLEQFENRRGYDLRYHLPALTGDETDEKVSRVRGDYRETISDLHIEYIRTWAKWARQKGALTRNQAHGSPTNLIDTYASADIPETEIYHSSVFDIPGLEYVSRFEDRPNIAMMKFASSAAHIAGNQLTAAESCTWLDEHFNVTLAKCKPELDQLFIGGINHIVYVATAYSPLDLEWPGNLIYASTNFEPANSIWQDFPALNEYVKRCQSILQSGSPDNDILLYYPVYDLWQRKDGLNERFGDLVQPTQVHYIHEWLFDTPFYDLTMDLINDGYSLDYVSDEFLVQSKIVDKHVSLGSNEYKIIVVPQTSYIPLSTMNQLLNLAKAGATVLFEKELPGDVPGLADLENRRKQLQNSLAQLEWHSTSTTHVKMAEFGKGKIYTCRDVKALLSQLKTPRETISESGIKFIRRTHSTGHHYFFSSLGNYNLDGWVTLGTKAMSAVLMDPMTGQTGVANIRQMADGKSQVYLKLKPGQSCILRTFTSKEVQGIHWKYLTAMDPIVEVEGDWQVTFIKGGPQLPANIKMRKLESWTKSGDKEAERFAGTARYQVKFVLPEIEADDWMLNLGKVCESARVIINDRDAGTVFGVPFKLRIGEYLKPGENDLTIEVTNLSANRIRDLDRRGVNWKKFYDINFVSINYAPFDASDWDIRDSGLIGPVQLVPMQRIMSQNYKMN